jgi:ADP-heptose:LPS heptosyltransferase
MKLKLKNIIKSLCFYCINFFILPSKNITEKSILLIRLDAIGDYILFRNFIEILKNSKQYESYKITLLGNSAWKNIAETVDSSYIDDFIWLDRNRFNGDIIYRYQKLKQITAKAYELILSPTYSREFFYADTFIKLLNANEKIGSIGDLSNIKHWQRNLSNRYYTKLLKADSNLMFEFYRNKEFFQHFLNEYLAIKKTSINIENINSSIVLPKKYAVLFLGANANFRKWSVVNFVEIAKFIQKEYQLDIVLCGDNTDKDAAIEFESLFAMDILNLVGKTSLLEILPIINNTELLIANETSAPHIAVALDMPNILVISNGNHFGRFTPYPKDLSDKYHVIYPPEIENNLSDYKRICNHYGNGSQLNINDIEIKDVIKKIDFFLKKDTKL